METSLAILCASASLMGVIHTALGPDHDLPFIELSNKLTPWALLVCGLAVQLGL